MKICPDFFYVQNRTIFHKIDFIYTILCFTGYIFLFGTNSFVNAIHKESSISQFF